MNSSPPQLWEPSPLTQKLKPSNWSQSSLGFTQAVKNCGPVASTKVNLQALPNWPSTRSTVPAGTFLLSLAVTSPGLCNTRLKSHKQRLRRLAPGRRGGRQSGRDEYPCTRHFESPGEEGSCGRILACVRDDCKLSKDRPKNRFRTPRTPLARPEERHHAERDECGSCLPAYAKVDPTRQSQSRSRSSSPKAAMVLACEATTPSSMSMAKWQSTKVCKAAKFSRTLG